MNPRAWPVTVAAAFATMLLLDTLRVWLPSVITVYGSADRGPVGHLSAVASALAAVVLVVGLVTTLVSRARRAGGLVVSAAAVMVLARLAVQLADGGGWQLLACSVAVLAGVGWLVGMATVTTDNVPVMTGVAAGVAVTVTLHASLRTLDLTWRSGVTTWVLLVCLMLGFLAAVLATVSSGMRRGPRPPAEAGSAWPWFATGPTLFLAGTVTGSPSRAEAAAGWIQYRPTLLLVFAAGLGVLACLWPRAITRHPLVAGAGFVAVVTGATAVSTVHDGTTGLLPQWTVWCQAGAAVLLGACLGWAGSGKARNMPTRRGWAAGFGVLTLFAMTFSYYAAYGVAVWVPHRLLLLCAAALVALAAWLGAVGRPHHTSVWGRRPGRWRAPALATGAAGCAVLVTLASTTLGSTSLVSRPDADFPVRVMTYNVRAGFDLSGRFVPAQLGDIIQAQRPDVVVLNEVDRGWFVMGGHDLLQLLAEELTMPYYFAPAADEVTGDAILSKIPMSLQRTARFSDEDVPIDAVVTSAVLLLNQSRRLGIVMTHLRRDTNGRVPVGQARLVADEAHQLADDGPVVVMGDFNAEPGSIQLATFGPRFVDALAPHRPAPTYPSDQPVRQIDHILVSADLRATDVAVPDVTASDHRPIAVTVTPLDQDPG